MSRIDGAGQQLCLERQTTLIGPRQSLAEQWQVVQSAANPLVVPAQQRVTRVTLIEHGLQLAS